MVTIGIIDTSPSAIHDTLFPPYCNAVKGSGADFRVLKWSTDEQVMNEYISACDGFIFTGGGDVDPSRYGEERIPECEEPLFERDEFELRFFSVVLGSRKPVLAICRGFQVLNVAFGGTLWQDIPSQVKNTYQHQPSPLEMIGERTHNAVIVQNTKLQSILNTNKLKVNSMHHQAVKELGMGLTLSAVSTDGIPEGFELAGHPFLVAVQWHPEWLFPQEDSYALFSALISASEEYKK